MARAFPVPGSGETGWRHITHEDGVWTAYRWFRRDEEVPEYGDWSWITRYHCLDVPPGEVVVVYARGRTATWDATWVEIRFRSEPLPDYSDDEVAATVLLAAEVMGATS
jgi:hypothetical protein